MTSCFIWYVTIAYRNKILSPWTPSYYCTYYTVYDDMFQPSMLTTFRSMTDKKHVEELKFQNKIHIYTSKCHIWHWDFIHTYTPVFYTWMLLILKLYVHHLLGGTVTIIHTIKCQIYWIKTKCFLLTN